MKKVAGLTAGQVRKYQRMLKAGKKLPAKVAQLENAIIEADYAAPVHTHKHKTGHHRARSPAQKRAMAYVKKHGKIPKGMKF